MVYIKSTGWDNISANPNQSLAVVFSGRCFVCEAIECESKGAPLLDCRLRKRQALHHWSRTGNENKYCTSEKVFWFDHIECSHSNPHVRPFLTRPLKSTSTGGHKLFLYFITYVPYYTYIPTEGRRRGGSGPPSKGRQLEIVKGVRFLAIFAKI